MMTERADCRDGCHNTGNRCGNSWRIQSTRAGARRHQVPLGALGQHVDTARRQEPMTAVP